MKMRLFRLLLLAAMLLSLFALPTGATEAVISEGFDSFAVGSEYTDTSLFTKADLPYEGVISRTIEDRDGDKFLKVTAQNSPTSGSVARARMRSVAKIGGTFTMEWDVKLFNDVTLDTYIRGADIRVRIKPGGGVALYVHNAVAVNGVMQTKNADFKLKTDAWYTLKVEASDEQMVLSAYDKSYNNLLMGTVTVAQSNATKENLFDPNQIWFDLSGAAAGDATEKAVGLDNIYLTEGTYEGVRSAAHSESPDANISIDTPKSTKANALKVLVLGDDGAMDVAAYLPKLGQLTGTELSIGCVYDSNGTLRTHSYFSAKRMEKYNYYKGNDSTGYEMVRVGGADRKLPLTWVLTEEKWDIIILQQGMIVDGLFTNYDNDDFDYMLDMLQDKAPQAKLYWHMNWAVDDEYSLDTQGPFNVLSDYSSWFNNEAAYHYNAILDCIDEYVLSDSRFEGVVYSGVAVENVRNTALGRTITRDQLYLNKAGRLAASMTALKTLVPGTDLSKVTASALDALLSKDATPAGTYTNTDANLALVRQSVEQALAGKPEKRTQKEVQPSVTDENIIVVAQSDVPKMYRFPNMTIMDDGTLIANFAECASHKQTVSDDPYQHLKEGYGFEHFYKSTDNGKTWQPTGFVLDTEQAEKWGLFQLTDRYERLKANPNLNYVVSARLGDTNLSSVHTDINGDGKKENILVMTFWFWFYYEAGQAETCRYTGLTYSTDGGMTWADPVKIENGLKRGDLTEFNDGSILVPLYSSPQAVRMEFKNGKWTEVYRAKVPNTSPDESTNFNEISFVSPRGDDTVYCLVRESGAVLRSDDAGKTWTEVGNEPGVIHQPAFCRLDDGRVFAVWAKVMSPRIVYGKTFYPDAHWSDTESQLIIDSPRVSHDMGNPFCVPLPDGRVYVMAYDLYYRSIVARIVDPTDPEYLPAELTDEKPVELYAENTGNKQLSEGGVSYKAVSGSYTTWLDFTLTEDNSSVTVQTTAGKVVIKANELDIAGTKSALTLALNVQTSAQVAVVGSTINVKVWQDGKHTQIAFSSEGSSLDLVVEKVGWKPEKFAYGVGDANAKLTPAITGSNALLHSWKLTKSLHVEFEKSAITQVGSPDLYLRTVVEPIQPDMTLTSSDPSVATIVNGNVHAVAPGKATITLSMSDQTFDCVVTVKKGSLELEENVLTATVFSDDFEQYGLGEDAFWNQMSRNGYSSNVSTIKDTLAMDIAEEDGNQYLVLGAAAKDATWHKVNQTLTGDYTVQFDYKYGNAAADAGIMYMTFWQDTVVHERTELRAGQIVNEYYPVKTDSGASLVGEKQTVKADVSSSGWYTFKGTRTNGSIMVKVWHKGSPEPAEWTSILSHSVLDSSQTSTFRFQYYNSSAAGNTFIIDNFTITQNVEKNNSAQKLADLGLMGGVGTNADGTTNFDLFRSPTRAEAMVMLLRLLGKESEVNKGGWEHPFTDVPAWANNWVGYAYQHNLTSGIGNNKFGSNDTATGAMYVTFVLRAMGYSDAAGEFSWDKPHALAASCGLIDKDDPLTDFLRGDLADVSVKALAAQAKDGTLMHEKLAESGAFSPEQYRSVVGNS